MATRVSALLSELAGAQRNWADSTDAERSYGLDEDMIQTNGNWMFTRTTPVVKQH